MEHRKIADGTWERGKPPESPAPPPVLETFGGYATTWVATRDIKPKAREGYEHILSKYLLPTFGARPLVEIKPPDVRAWWCSMDPGTPTVRARAYGVLKAVMNTAVADDLVDANPCRMRGASNAPRARDVRPATVEELAVTVEAMPERYRALVLLGAWCALRSGEMLELRRRDVDLGDELTKNGVMEPARLFETPYTDHAPTGPDYFFPDVDVEVIVDTLEHIRQTAVRILQSPRSDSNLRR